jgi:hypothetical protein
MGRTQQVLQRHGSYPALRAVARPEVGQLSSEGGKRWQKTLHIAVSPETVFQVVEINSRSSVLLRSGWSALMVGLRRSESVRIFFFFIDCVMIVT